jgi:Phage integrase SAM-like domain
MASISHDGGGYRRLQFKLNGKRQKVHLGKTTAKSAETIRAHVEAIIESRELNRSMEAETATWLRGLGDDLYSKLAGKGLLQSRKVASDSLLERFIDDFIAKRQAKPGSKEVWREGKMGLVEFFGPNRPLAEITAGLADDYLEFLKAKVIKSRAREPGNAPAKTLSSMTIRKRLQFAKMIFRAAVRHKLIDADPFAENAEFCVTEHS